MTTGAPDPSIGEINEMIAELQMSLQILEDWHHAGPEYDERDTAIRDEIDRLRHLRDLLPESGRG